METSILIILIAVLITGFFMLRSSPQSVKGRRVQAKNVRSTISRERSRYRSVSVVCESGACDAAKSIAQKRFLSSEVPLFPLADCTSSTCSCKYIRHDDRRNPGGDRRVLVALSTEHFEQTGRYNRRIERGRRHSDWVAA